MKKRTVIMIMALLPFVLAITRCSNGTTGDPVPYVQKAAVLLEDGELLVLEISDPSGTSFDLAAGTSYHYRLLYKGYIVIKEGNAEKDGDGWKCYEGGTDTVALKLGTDQKIEAGEAPIKIPGTDTTLLAENTKTNRVSTFTGGTGEVVIVTNIPDTYTGGTYKIAADGLKEGGGNDSGLFWCGNSYGQDTVTTIPINSSTMILPVVVGRNKPWSNVELSVTVTTNSSYRVSGHGGGQPATKTVQKHWSGVNFSGGITKVDWDTGMGGN